jgi:hypothetical protein
MRQAARLRELVERSWVLWAGVLVLWALVPVAVAVIHVLRHGGVITGTDAVLAGADQQQYMAMIREAGTHLLIGNPFRLGASSPVYLDPMYLISGVLWRLGVDLRLSLLLWTPVAAGLLARGVWGYVRRFLGPGEYLAAAALALFFFSPVLPVLAWSGVQLSAHVRSALLLTSGDATPGWQLWGYLPTAIVLGLMPLCLLGIERALQPGRATSGRSPRWYLGWSSVAGLIIGWLHPWQGLILVAIIGGVVTWGRFAPRYRVLALPALATVAPMLYIFVLSRTNHDWRIFSLQNRAFHDPVWVLLVALLPLLVPAMLGIRKKVADDGERMLLLWPVAAVAVYLVIPEFPFHALQEISLPLAVLAVRGYRRLSLPKLAGLVCVLVVTIPGFVFLFDTFHTNISQPYAPYWLTDGENAALRYLSHTKVRGGVLSRYYLGMTVPAFTGRSTYVGHYVWTPDFSHRLALTEQLFAGQLPVAEARGLVRSIAPTYVLTDCETPVNLAPILGPLIVSTHRFGCAAVYQVKR